MTEQPKRNRKRGHRDMEPAVPPKYPPGVRKRIHSFGRIKQEVEKK